MRNGARGKKGRDVGKGKGGRGLRRKKEMKNGMFTHATGN